MGEIQTEVKTGINATLTTIDFSEPVIADVKRICNLASKLELNINIKTTEKEMCITGFDINHIALMYASIPATIINPKEISMVMENFNKIIKKTTDHFRFVYDPVSKRLEIIDGIARFKMTYTEIDTEEPKFDLLMSMRESTKNSMQIDAKKFEQFLDRIDPITEVLYFKDLPDNRIQLHNEGLIADFQIDLGKPFVDEITVVESFDECYAMSFLKLLAIKDEETFIHPTFRFQSESPLLVEETFPSGCKIYFWLAPRVTE
jgi:hypothetical protein